ncbi:MAG: histone-like protein [Promethearchaeota archaeon]
MAKKKASFAWSPIRRLMKQQGASIVARDAVDLLIDHLEKTAVGLTEQARAFTQHANRKKITKNDLLLAIKYK